MQIAGLRTRIWMVWRTAETNASIHLSLIWWIAEAARSKLWHQRIAAGSWLPLSVSHHKSSGIWQGERHLGWIDRERMLDGTFGAGVKGAFTTERDIPYMPTAQYGKSCVYRTGDASSLCDAWVVLVSVYSGF